MTRSRATGGSVPSGAYARGEIRSQADLDDVLGKGDPEVFIEYGPDGPRRVRVKADGMQPDPRTG